MLTTKYVRENLGAIRKSLQKRGSKYPLEELLQLDEKLKKINKELQDLRAERNKGSEQIGAAKKSGKDPDKTLVGRMGEVKNKIDDIEKEIPDDEARLETLLWSMPNILDDSVPEGTPPEANKVIKTWGKPVPKNIPTHEEILGKLNMLDVERASKTTGARFYFMKGDLVLLELSLMRYVMDFLTKRGYTPVLPPFMLKKKYYKGAAPLATFEDALYRVGESEEASKLKDADELRAAAPDRLQPLYLPEQAIFFLHAISLQAASYLPITFLPM